MYDNYYADSALKNAYNAGYTDAQYLNKNYNPYPAGSIHFDAYENGFCDWLDNDDYEEIIVR